MIYINIYSIVGRNFLKEIFCNPVGFNIFCKMGNWGVNGVWLGVDWVGIGVGVEMVYLYILAGHKNFKRSKNYIHHIIYTYLRYMDNNDRGRLLHTITSRRTYVRRKYLAILPTP